MKLLLNTKHRPTASCSNPSVKSQRRPGLSDPKATSSTCALVEPFPSSPFPSTWLHIAHPQSWSSTSPLRLHINDFNLLKSAPFWSYCSPVCFTARCHGTAFYFNSTSLTLWSLNFSSINSMKLFSSRSQRWHPHYPMQTNPQQPWLLHGMRHFCKITP